MAARFFSILWRLRLVLLPALAVNGAPLLGQTTNVPAPAPNTAVVLSLEGIIEGVEAQRRGATRWDRAYTNQVLDAGDLFRTGRRSRATLRLSRLETLRVAEGSVILIPEDRKPGRALEFIRGVFYFFHREKPGEIELRTRWVNSVVRGTDFVIEVGEDGATKLDLIDGVVEMNNEFGALTLNSGESGLVEPGKAPVRTAAIEAASVIQWILYYPASLNLDELVLNDEEQTALQQSLEAYRSGDLLAALASYPAQRMPESNREKIYLATVVLSVGNVTEAEALLDSLKLDGAGDEQLAELAEALSLLIRAVKFQGVEAENASPHENTRSSLREVASSFTQDGQGLLRSAATIGKRTSTSLLAESYVYQARFQLDKALALARQAAASAPNFAFAHARVAELEFSLGHTRPAQDAVEKSLALAPRNAQAAALKGFVLTAANKFVEAETWFDRAIGLDGGLGNGWLGRGLCRIRQGRAEEGRQDLQVASTVEPQRAILRSYLGKAFDNAGQQLLAEKELTLAKRLDPRDPTAWLYSALLRQQENRVNEAVQDLEKSKALNENRAIYRSRLLLDQDRSVRSANLAHVYRDAGMDDVSVREAGRAVNDNYANYSAHLFLANSYDRLRDPRQINLRYETAWLSEYLLANLLSPASAGSFSPAISQQEYSRLFERDRLGVISYTEYLSNGDWLESGAQYGVLGNTSYAVEANYRSENGWRQNSEQDQLTLWFQLKQQLTPQDTVFLQGIYYDAEAGDVAPRYYQTNANLGLRTEEHQRPTLLVGYHHEWTPEHHTLFLGGRLEDTYRVANTNQQTLFVQRNFASSNIDFIDPITLDQRYRSELAIYTAEAQQIWQTADHNTVLGARYQTGEFDTINRENSAALTTNQSVLEDFERISLYGYHWWQVMAPLQLVGGLSYDRLSFPENFRYGPIAEGEEHEDQVSPKLGFVWTPTTCTTVRGAYARSLGGVSLDQSDRLEPSQVAGFNQAYRSVIPEAVAGSLAGSQFETRAVSLEQKFGRNTYLAVAGEWLSSKVERDFGVVEFGPVGGNMLDIYSAQMRETLDFEERSLTVTLNQLIGDEWSFGASYRLSLAELRERFPELPDAAIYSGGVTNRLNSEALLHQLNLFMVFNNPSGFFARADAFWYAQSNRKDSAVLPGDDFWQFHVFAGWRFWQRRMEARVGVLNLTDQNYRLNPLNSIPEPQRERTFMASLRFSF